jgi:hypothetical protein
MSRLTNSKFIDRTPNVEEKNPGFAEDKHSDANKSLKTATLNGKTYLHKSLHMASQKLYKLQYIKHVDLIHGKLKKPAIT